METLEEALEREKTTGALLRTKLMVDVWMHPLFLLLMLYFIYIDEGISAFKTFYFGLGGFQLMSALLHLNFEREWNHRKKYYIQLIAYGVMFLLVAIGSVVPVLESLMVFLLPLLILTPLTAIHYFVLSLQDYNHYRKQPWY